MLTNLSPSRREAVCCGMGPCEVIAGPGSGKTLVLTERILYLISHFEIAPSRILVLTFSRSAAAEMKGRFDLRTSGNYPGVVFGTFHSVFFHILKESTHHDYKILSGAVRDRLLSRLLCRYYPDPLDRPSLEEAEKIVRSASSFGRTQDEDIRRDYRLFLKENGYVDFDDMILECRNVLTADRKVREYWSRRFAAILVDEFQDINAEQYAILRLLSSGRGLFVVGDDDQSIYGFRGSDPGIMMRFMKDFADAERIFLSLNYRCSGCICRAASLLISENRIRIPKEMTSAGPMGDRTVLTGFEKDSGEMRYLLRELRKLAPEELTDTAVIVRTNTHAVKIEKYLTENGIAVSGKTGVPQNIRSAVIRDLTAYLLLADGARKNMYQRNALFRVMNRPQRFILRSAAPSEYMSAEALLTHSGRPDPGVQELLEDLAVLRTLAPEGFVRYLYYSIGYAEWAAGNLGGKDQVRAALDRILEEISPLRDLGEMRRALQKEELPQRDPDVRGVRIMTMHVSKGLEFSRVYLPALNEGIIPGRRCRTVEDYEEERRLLYVAMTRARSHLELMYTKGTVKNPRPPSRFLSVYGIRNFVSSGR